MLYIWLGYCKLSTYHPDKMFQVVYDEDWFEDDLVKEIVLDLDKTTVVNHALSLNYLGDPMNTLDISGSAKCLIMMYKIPNLLITGIHMGDNCAKWIIKLAQMQDCYMTLEYDLAFHDDIHSKEEFYCTIMNNGFKTKTFSDYFDVYCEYPRDNEGSFPELLELPPPLISPYEVLYTSRRHEVLQ
ncbi:MAG: DUF4869 domain-containing protein [Clostridiales bacterium]|nr:DUF4869 domain-containing protein [Clostridiales bacterium]